MKSIAIEAGLGAGAGVGAAFAYQRIPFLQEHPWATGAALLALGFLAKKKNASAGTALMGAGGFALGYTYVAPMLVQKGLITANPGAAAEAGRAYPAGYSANDVAAVYGYMANATRGDVRGALAGRGYDAGAMQFDAGAVQRSSAMGIGRL
jgi:hypothetical protein